MEHLICSLEGAMIPSSLTHTLLFLELSLKQQLSIDHNAKMDATRTLRLIPGNSVGTLTFL
jgi:hypothetical protein